MEKKVPIPVDQSWIRSTPKGVLISCHIQPRSSRTEIVGLHGNPPRLKIKIAAPPVDGEANEEMIFFLSKLLKISKSKIHITSGASGKHKDILVTDLDFNEVVTRFEDR